MVLESDFPQIPFTIRRQVSCISGFDVSALWVDAAIFGSTPLEYKQKITNPVRFCGLVMQLIANVVFVANPSAACIPVGTCVFTLGVIEAGMEFWKAWLRKNE